jgi:excisionase family DNA binding protein
MSNLLVVSIEDFKKAINEVLDEREGVAAAQERMSEEYMTTKDICSLLNISSSTLWRMTQDGRITPKKVGRRSLYNKAEVIALVQGNVLAKFNR